MCDAHLQVCQRCGLLHEHGAGEVNVLEIAIHEIELNQN